MDKLSAVHISSYFYILNCTICIIILTFTGNLSALKDADLKDGKIQEKSLNVGSFVIMRKKVTQSEAMHICETRGSGGGRLAVLSEKEDAEKVSAAIKSISEPYKNDTAQFTHEFGMNRRYWIGLVDLIKEGEWVWQKDGSLLQYDFWYPGQPDHNKAGKTPKTPEHCAVFWNPIYYEKESHTFNDENCVNKHYFICESPSTAADKKGKSLYGQVIIDTDHDDTNLPFGVTLNEDAPMAGRARNPPGTNFGNYHDHGGTAADTGTETLKGAGDTGYSSPTGDISEAPTNIKYGIEGSFNNETTSKSGVGGDNNSLVANHQTEARPPSDHAVTQNTQSNEIQYVLSQRRRRISNHAS